ncbi:DeoR/GlpR family DNA-binding transcription regulator [Aestuariispira insulae]|uniref:DeoR family transcriptional regulator n=1 Tax=Aestuariispira insulae TaxID=1461337 RepID=A0A3D9HWV3_9PROT|nr:DeoR/GlpR family DNA-binding transcription regulator [Aestuariispira insulae]RED53895.1 DeoR family transcriptional regulator [Aestuariispira insulae]
MQLNDRQNDILNWVRDQGFLAIDNLADHYRVSTQTIRKDINGLCEHGLARRVHGGISRSSSSQNLSFFARQTLNANAKQVIAKRAVADIPDGASLFMGIGTTVEFVAKELLGKPGLKVKTNNLNVAAILCADSDIDVQVSGGRLRHNDRDLVGQETTEFFERFRVDIGLIGAGGLETDYGMLDFQEEEANVTRSILANARHRILLCDSTKWGRPAMVKVGGFEQIDAFYTDNLPREQDLSLLRRPGLAIVETGAEDIS